MNLSNIKKILVIRTDRFGEFILSLPVIRAIRKKIPSSYVCVMANSFTKELIEHNPDINDIIIYDEKNMLGLLNTAKLLNDIKKREFDLVIILNPKKKFNILAFLAGIPIRLGYDRKWGFLLNHKIKDQKSLGQKHEIEYNLDLIRSVGIDCEDKKVDIFIQWEDDQFVSSILSGLSIQDTDKLLALHPWTSDPIKQWPMERFLTLAKRINSELGYKVVIIGGKQEVKDAEDFCRKNDFLINLSGKFSLRQSAAFLKKCKALISNDSGPVHLACAVGVPVIAIFRNDLPAKSSKRWGPWIDKCVVVENKNIYDIDTELVFNKAKGVL